MSSEPVATAPALTDDRDRRDVLADAAIAIVARGGMRALTHRAVDADAGMPQGTTSAYFRTRSALVVGLTRRLADLDRRELSTRQLQAGGPLMGGPEAPAPTPELLDRVADGTADLIVRLTTTLRDRTLARYACMLETTHRPELHELLQYRQAATAQTVHLLRWAGAPDPAGRARDYVAAVDGMILDRILDPSGASVPPREAVRRLLRAAVGGGTGEPGAPGP